MLQPPSVQPLITRLIALTTCFCLLLIGLTVSSLIASRKGELNDTATSTANMARALASHAERSIKIGDAVLGEMLERINNEPFDAASVNRMHARLQNIVTATPELQELFIYSESGRRITTSLDTTLPGSNADREFFQYHRTHADHDLHVGNPIRSRSSGVLTIPLSRRINRPDGSFGGVVMASLNLRFFGRFYDSFDVGKSGTIILVIDDGTLLYRRPLNVALVGTKVNVGVMFRHYKENGPIGTAMLVSNIDGIERMYSYRHLDGLPLLVAIAESKDEILAAWHATLIQTCVVVLFAVAMMIWGAYRMVQQLRIRAELEDELRSARAVTESLNVALQALANTDSLTGLANRRRFEATLALEQERARRNGNPCSLILGDIDYFKKYNDHYGHVAGDTCLRQVAEAIAAGPRRPADLAARYGGEEFVVVLPETDQEGAAAVARNIRARIASLRIDHAASPFGHVTLSLGVYTAYAGANAETPEAWIKAADALLYEAKAAGRDQFVARGEGRPSAGVFRLQKVG